MTEKRDWRDAKIPAWVRDAITDEMSADKLRLALAWPPAPRPTPVFRVAGYGRIVGNIKSGDYWCGGYYGSRRYTLSVKSEYSGTVADETGKEIGSPPQAAYFTTEADAILFSWWDKGDEVAMELLERRNAWLRAMTGDAT